MMRALYFFVLRDSCQLVLGPAQLGTVAVGYGLLYFVSYVR